MAEGGTDFETAKFGHLNKQTETGHFQIVDYDDQLIRDVEEMRDELHKQALSINTKLKLLWDVVRALIVLILPVLGGIGLAVISKTFLPVLLGNSASALFVSGALAFVILNLPPLNDTVNALMTYKVYDPEFTKCGCDSCKEKITNVEVKTDQAADELTKDSPKIEEIGSGNAEKWDKESGKVKDSGLPQPKAEVLNASTNAGTDDSDTSMDSLMKKYMDQVNVGKVGETSLQEELNALVEHELTDDVTQHKEEAETPQTSESGSGESIGVLDEKEDVVHV